MKNYAPMLMLCMLLLSACIKHPQELPLPKPLLIKKVTQVVESYRQRPRPGDSAVSSFYKNVWEIEYDKDWRPWLRRRYSSNKDTSTVHLFYTDILLYDRQGRIKEIRTQGAGGGSVGRTIYSYNGNDKLPSHAESIPAGDYTTGYLYRGDTVIETFHHDLGVDTLRYLFRNGNLLFGIGTFDRYDDDLPIQKFMNLQRGDIFNFLPVPFTPRLSRNNWIEFHTPYSRWRRYIRHNELGLPYLSSAREVAHGFVQVYNTRFEY